MRKLCHGLCFATMVMLVACGDSGSNSGDIDTDGEWVEQNSSDSDDSSSSVIPESSTSRKVLSSSGSSSSSATLESSSSKEQESSSGEKSGSSKGPESSSVDRSSSSKGPVSSSEETSSSSKELESSSEEMSSSSKEPESSSEVMSSSSKKPESSSEEKSSSSVWRPSSDGSIYDATANTLTDFRDGLTYRTVKIGGQVWMAENLNYRYQGSTATLDSSSFCYDNDPVKAKYILNKGIIYLPKSEKLYFELIKLEKNDNEKKKILKKCLFEKIPTSEILWKMLIELEKNNPEIYKRLLIKCTEYFPKSINNWILLSKECDYEEGKEYLLKAIKLNEDSWHIRMFYLFFEEKENKNIEKKEEILTQIFNNIVEEFKNKEQSNEELISFACESEKNNCLISNKIIVNYTLKNYFNKSSYKKTKTAFKKIIEDIKSQEYKYIYTIKQIYITLLQLNDNKDIELWVKYIDFIKTNISVEEVENIFKEAIKKATKDVFKETFYLLYAKILKENNEIDKAINLLKDE